MCHISIILGYYSPLLYQLLEYACQLENLFAQRMYARGKEQIAPNVLINVQRMYARGKE
jgi:hypothetical protein